MTEKIRDVKLYHVHRMSRECHLYKDLILDKISPSLYPPGVLGINKLWSSQNSCPNPTQTRSGLAPINRSLPSMTDPWKATLKEDLRMRPRNESTLIPFLSFPLITAITFRVYCYPNNLLENFPITSFSSLMPFVVTPLMFRPLCPSRDRFPTKVTSRGNRHNPEIIVFLVPNYITLHDGPFLFLWSPQHASTNPGTS